MELGYADNIFNQLLDKLKEKEFHVQLLYNEKLVYDVPKDLSHIDIFVKIDDKSLNINSFNDDINSVEGQIKIFTKVSISFPKGTKTDMFNSIKLYLTNAEGSFLITQKHFYYELIREYKKLMIQFNIMSINSN